MILLLEEPGDIEMLKLLDALNAEDLNLFAKNWRKQAKVQVLIQGNITEERALNISNTIAKGLEIGDSDEVFE